MEYGLMPGRYPAIVKTYSQARRTCRVEIPGLTDGGDVLPEAEIEYPIGDKSRAGANTTEQTPFSWIVSITLLINSFLVSFVKFFILLLFYLLFNLIISTPSNAANVAYF